MLVKVDRMSMAHSLETRTPFLDHRVVELLCGVHKSVKMDGWQRKSILRNTVARRLPGELLNARKRGFAVPLRDWFREGEFTRRAEELPRSGHLDLDAAALRETVRRNQAREEDHGELLWMLMVLERTAARSAVAT
jgi:asparagine synthase (glutamine-hydrolysing)